MRVAVYCRVSTDKSDQVNSLASQKRYFKEYIKRQMGWELAQVFVDSGITGTSTKKRAAFQEMLLKAQAGEFDLILTKEISRFARNTLDSIYYTRMLKEYGVGVIFMNDNINTLDSDAELRLTIMSSIAQEESRKTSDRVKWGQKRRMEQGVVFGRDLLGYDVREGKLYVNHEGAETVRRIFHKYVVEGKGVHTIAQELEEEGEKLAPHMKRWTGTGVLRCIMNEKYCGDLMQKKTYTPSYLTHEKKKNSGQEEMVFLPNHHEGIISKELFMAAQQERKRRSKQENEKTKYTNTHCFSGKIKCGVCGSSYVSRSKKRKDQTVNRRWRCYQATVYGMEHGEGQKGCGCPSVGEEDLKFICQEIVRHLPCDTQRIVTELNRQRKPQKDSSQETQEQKLESKMKELCEKKERLLDLYMSKLIEKEEFCRQRQKLNLSLSRLENTPKKQDHPVKPTQTRTKSGEEWEQFIGEILAGKRWNDGFYKNLVREIRVQEDGSVMVYLWGMEEGWKGERIEEKESVI